MANRVKGETTIRALGQRWTLAFTTNALCELEDRAEMSVPAFLRKLEAGATAEDIPIKDFRLLFWAGLWDACPDVTERKAGEIIEDLGGVMAAGQLLQEALSLSLRGDPAGAPDGEGDAPGNGMAATG